MVYAMVYAMVKPYAMVNAMVKPYAIGICYGKIIGINFQLHGCSSLF